jgi:hypothetical protein
MIECRSDYKLLGNQLQAGRCNIFAKNDFNYYPVAGELLGSQPVYPGSLYGAL